MSRHPEAPGSGSAVDLLAGAGDRAGTRERILRAATEVLASDAGAPMRDIADAAQVGRSTLYRHFASRTELLDHLWGQRGDQGPLSTRAHYVGEGTQAQLAPAALEGSLAETLQILDDVPPHEVAATLVVHAQRVAGTPIALYTIDIDGSHLLRAIGPSQFPERIPIPLAIGPEIADEGLPALTRAVATTLPGCTLEPMFLRHRAVGALMAIGRPQQPLAPIARLGAAVLELSTRFTDAYESARRRKDTTAAAETQQACLPPRLARIAGGRIAGSVLPSYDVGGDWFDHAENRDGTWLAVADAAGRGGRAAGLAAAVLGALRSARRDGDDLEGVVRQMQCATFDLAERSYFVTGIVAHWHAATRAYRWVNCGHPPALHVTADGEIRALDDVNVEPLGLGEREREFPVGTVQLASGDRVVHYSDGVTERSGADGTRLGVEAIVRAIRAPSSDSAAATTKAIQEIVLNGSENGLRDDATVLVFTVD